MKITLKDNKTTFKDVKLGEIFTFQNDTYMVTNTVEVKDRTGEVRNAVKLNTGVLCFFRDGVECEKINCELKEI